MTDREALLLLVLIVLVGCGAFADYARGDLSWRDWWDRLR